MKRTSAPDLETRRAADFENELLTRARTWIPEWSLDESQADFGLALLKIAARFNSEVAERLDKAGTKMALGFLDWLGMPALAARPARMPVVLKLADTAREPIFAVRPVKMQVDVGDATVTFETETNLQIIPGQLAAVVGVDPETDSYYLPPPGLTSLDPLEPLPTAWKLKNFAAPGAKAVQLDPGVGLVPDMLVEIAGDQFRIEEAKDDLVKIDPEVPSGEGFAAGTRVAKVETFRPFGGARNLQEHILYVGDSDAFNVEAEALIEVIGPAALREGTTWDYWGKADGAAEPDAEAAWINLPMSDLAPQRMVLTKPKGPIEEKEVEGTNGRWIRARRTRSNQPIETDSIRVRINPSDMPDPAAIPAAEPPPIELFVNATASPSRKVFLLGQEPRLFDTLYVGCAEAFSKPDADARIAFDLSDGAFEAMAAFAASSKLGPVLAAVDKGGSLHLFRMGADGKLGHLNNREPLRPEPRDAPDSGASNFSLTSSDLRPVMWMVWDTLFVAVAANGEIWVRVESPPLFGSFSLFAPGQWQYWGAPSGGRDDTIKGLAVFSRAGVPTLVAMTASGALKRKASASAPWEDQPVTLPNNHLLLSIANIRSGSSLKAADNFLAVTEASSIGPFTLRLVPGGGQTIPNIDPSMLIPFGFESGGTTAMVAGKRSPARLVAKRGTANGEVELDEAELSSPMLDGNDATGELTVHGVGQVDGAPVLLSWAPFDSDISELLIATPIDLLTAAPKGAPALNGDRIYVPGDTRGEVLTATVAAPVAFQENANRFRSTVAVSSSAALPAAIESLAVMDGTTPVLLGVEGPRTAGEGDYAGSTFLWLDGELDPVPPQGDVFLFPPAPNPLPAGTVVSHTPPAAPTESEFDLGQVLPDGTVLIVNEDVAGTSEQLVTVISMAGTVATVEPALTAADTLVVGYRIPQTVAARVFPSLTLDGINSVDANRARTGGIYFPDLVPHRQPVIAFAETSDPTEPEFVAFELEWTNGPAGNVDFFVGGAPTWSQARAATSVTAVLAWEYWDGTSWSVLELEEDGTSHLRQSGIVRFVVPNDLKPVDWAGKTNHWIRARLVGGNYGEAKVEVITQQSGTTSTQTVKRTTDDLKPPYALNVSVTYSVDKAIVPSFVLTRDSGTLRNQSDANRTPGAVVEIFTPLSVALGRLDGPLEADPSLACIADCECDTGAASTSPAPASMAARISAPASASGAGRRALYLGFTSKLVGQPVNLLFNVALENDYDAIAPLGVDALIGDRFAPIVSTDATRGLGETGLLTMAFDVAPLTAELFGRALSWLRLAPRVGSTDWTPSIAGIYPNGIWTRAAETMTRELLGSSDGRPNLTVTLARPPLLQDTLELRVREPLGQEELDALTVKDPNLVKSAETDLPGHWILWTQVPDPTDCGPADRVYSLDETTGAVRFGDGLHGMIPPVGVDAIVAFAYERTEAPVGDELAANLVRPRTELNLVTPVESVESAIAGDRSAGGVGPESSDRVRAFAPATLRHRGRAVSLRDFEDLARQKSDDIAQARAFRRNGRVRIVVVRRGANPSPSRAQRRELRRALLEIAPAALGAPNRLTITGPRLRKLRISLGLRVSNLDVGGTVASDAKKKIVERFQPGGGWALGRTPREDDLAETLLDIAGLDGIDSIDLFELDDTGEAAPWHRPAARDELVIVAPADVRIDFDVMEAAA